MSCLHPSGESIYFILVTQNSINNPETPINYSFDNLFQSIFFYITMPGPKNLSKNSIVFENFQYLIELTLWLGILRRISIIKIIISGFPTLIRNTILRKYITSHLRNQSLETISFRAVQCSWLNTLQGAHRVQHNSF